MTKHIPRTLLLVALLSTTLFVLFLAPSPTAAQTPEFRAYWVDAWHNGAKTPAQCDQLIADMQTSNCNVAVVQMRRRGDTYYPSAYEPFASDADPSFDALRYLLDHCHAANIQVHAWLVYIPVYQNSSPTFPSDPAHPANLHPEFLSENNSGSVWELTGTSTYHLNFDPGHPACEQYLNDIVMELVDNYPDLDGISYDYSRFPGTAWGYNDVSVARYNARYGLTGTPGTSDPLWCQWRRDQITNLIRKTYVNAIALNPNICMSSAVVTWHPTPMEAGSFPGTRPYYEVFQDWDGWMAEGILDLSMPMCYFDRDGSYSMDYDDWMNFAKTHQYNRGTVIGPGIYMNDITDSIYQIRQTRDLYNGYTSKGAIMYSYATTNDQGAANYTFYNALSSPSSYDPNPTPVFNTPVPVPTFPWKAAPIKGHIRGTVTEFGQWVDGVTVNLTGPESRSMPADGTGFYAFIDLTPGTYTVSVNYGELKQVQAVVTAGQVFTADINFGEPDPTPPVITNVQVANVTHNEALITWDSDDPSTSQVEYGLTSSYGSATAEDTVLVTSHTVLVQGLDPNTTYHFRVKSTNRSGLTSYSGDSTFATAAAPMEIIIDNLDPEATFTGTWTSGAYGGGWPTSASEYAWTYNNRNQPTATCTWTPNIPLAGKYDVYIWFLAGSNRTTSARYTITYAGGTTGTIYVNQRDGAIDSQWYKIASGLQFDAGTSGNVQLTNRTGESPGTTVVIADAVRFEYVDVDVEPPTVPQNLQAAADSTTDISLTWSPSTDNVAVAGYKVYRNSVLVATSPTESFADSGLTPNTQYTYAVLAYDGRLNESAQSAPASRYTLSVPPTPSSITCDKSTNTWYNTAAFIFTNGGFGPGKVDYYRYSWDNSSTHTWTGTETIWAVGTKTVSAASGPQPWYFHVCGYNGDDVANGSADLGPYYYDGAPPAMGQVVSPMYLGIIGTTFDDLSAEWSATDGESGVAEYQYAIGTSPGAADILGWTSSGTATAAAYHYADALLHDYNYYFTVKAKDQASNWSAAAVSNASVYADVYDTLAAAMDHPDDTPVIVSLGKVLSANFGNCFYVQEPDRARGLRIDLSAPWQMGELAYVAGRLGSVDGERLLRDVEAYMEPGPGAPKPLAMPIKAVGGVAPDAHTLGVSGSYGAYNLGLLVRTAGRVVDKGTGYFALADGSGATIKVYSDVVPPDNAFVGATGIASVEAGARVLRTRSSADVQTY